MDRPAGMDRIADITPAAAALINLFAGAEIEDEVGEIDALIPGREHPRR